jgi:beta-fructofuranosidase
MVVSPYRVGFLEAGDRSAEERAAFAWCAEVFESAERVDLPTLAAGGAELDRFDAVWWHRDRPLPESGVTACADALDGYLRDGGGLLLTLRALEAVEPLGIDPVAPDVAVETPVHEPTGYLVHALYEDHPLLSGLGGDLRVHTRGSGGRAAGAWYEAVLPGRGDVLGATVEGETDHPPRSALCSWRPGDGLVLGAGVALEFSELAADPYAHAGTTLVRNALATLARGPAALSGMAVEPTGSARDASHLRSMRRALRGDRHRPAYHLAPPANWLNDPNGLARWDGRYHVFYQYNPAGPFHGSIHWGHATSEDLVTWRDEPVALSPDPEGPDRDGCWSGCAVDDDGTPRAIYTGGSGRRQLPCLATATDDTLRRWVKDPGNPIIPETPDDLDLLETEDWETEFRDHCVWREDGTWYQLIGSGVTDVGGTALLYESADGVREWTSRGPVLTGDWPSAGIVWECPEVLFFGEWDLLHVSNGDNVDYFVGEMDVDEGAFRVEGSGRLDYGDFYAPQSLEAEDGRTLTWGWIPETRDLAAQWDAGWSGLLSVPRVLDVDADGTLRQRPPRELRSLRGRHVGYESVPAGPNPTVLDVRGRSLELRLDVALGDADAFELGVLESPDGRERTAVRWEGVDVVLDRQHSAETEGGAGAASDPLRMPVADEDPLSLHVFVDRSVVEVFANGRRCLTGRVYPGADSAGVSVRGIGGTADVERVDVWELSDGVREE